jgi:hypothetical protein
MSEAAVVVNLCRHVPGTPHRPVIEALLAAHLGCPVADVSLARTAAGKPYLRSSVRAKTRFSVAHCPGLLVLAVGSEEELGVDVELGGQQADPRAFRRFMTTQERAGLAQFGPAAIVPWWVRKEAVLKAAGVGLQADLRDWPVPVGDHPGVMRAVGRNGVVHQVRDVRRGRYALAVARAGEAGLTVQVHCH